MTSNLINIIFYLFYQNGFTAYKAYDTLTQKQRETSKFCTVLPKEIKKVSRAATSSGNTVTEYEADILVSTYFSEEADIDDIYEICDTMTKAIAEYSPLNAKSIFLKDVSYSAPHRMIKRDMIITISYIEEEQ